MVRNLFDPVEVLAPAEAYRLWAPSYDDRGDNAILFLEEKEVLPILANCVLPGKRVIDFGCGTGRHLRHCKELGVTELVGVDISREMLAIARGKLGSSGADLIEAHIKELPLIRSIFDVGIASLSLSHVENLMEAVSGISGVIRSGGVVIVSDLHWSFDERGWKRTFRSVREPGRRLAVQNCPHSLSEYKTAFAGAGFLVEKMAEPVIDESVEPVFRRARMSQTYTKYRGQPLLVVFQLRKQ